MRFDPLVAGDLAHSALYSCIITGRQHRSRVWRVGRRLADAIGQREVSAPPAHRIRSLRIAILARLRLCWDASDIDPKQ